MGSEQAAKYHSVTFGTKNTWDDWGLIPNSRPSIAPPELKKYDAESDAMNGKNDLTEVFGAPIYGKASGSMTFLISNPGTYDYAHTGWTVIRNDIYNYLHNRRRTLILDDDPGYYYEGRFQVSFSTSKNWSTVTINYDIDLYHQPVPASNEAETGVSGTE